MMKRTSTTENKRIEVSDMYLADMWQSMPELTTCCISIDNVEYVITTLNNSILADMTPDDANNACFAVISPTDEENRDNTFTALCTAGKITILCNLPNGIAKFDKEIICEKCADSNIVAWWGNIIESAVNMISYLTYCSDDHNRTIDNLT